MMEPLRILRTSSLVLSGKVVSGILTYAATIIIARFYGPRTMGLFFLGFSVFDILSTLAKAGLDSAVLRHVAIYKSQMRSVWVRSAVLGSVKRVFLVGSVLGLILFAAADFIAVELFGKEDLSVFLRIFGVLLPFFSVWAILVETLKALKAVQEMVLNQNLLFPVGNVVCILIFFYLVGAQPLALATAYGVSVLLFGLTAGILLLLRVFPEMKKGGGGLDFKFLLRDSYPILGNSLILLSMFWTDTVIIGVVRTAEEVGIYGAAAKTALLSVVLLVSMGMITAPLFAEYYHEGKIRELEAIARMAARWSVYGSALVCIVTILHAGHIMGFFGFRFEVGILALILLSLAQVLNTGTGLVGQLLIMTGHVYSLLWVTGIAAIMNMALNITLVPRWGISGAAAATGISLVMMNVLLVRVVRNRIGVKAYTDRIATIVVVSVLSLGIGIGSSDIAPPYAAGLIAGTAYVLLLVVSGVARRERECLYALTIGRSPTRGQ